MLALPPLPVEPLRRLTLGRDMPMAAASGLVCAGGRAWVIADDRLHLACFADIGSAGALRRLLPGRLPTAPAARKAAKPDFECLFAWRHGLVVLGSGSRPNRGVGVVADSSGVHPFSLEPVYAPLRERFGPINVEGAFVQSGHWVLLLRGVAGGAPNAVARWPVRVLERVLAGRQDRVAPTSLRTMSLGHLDGVALGFTDGTPLPDGSWLFAAVAEDTRDSYDDGACAGSVIGRVDARGRIAALRRVEGRLKVEGMAAHQAPGAGLQLALVTDADDPAQASWLLRSRW